MNTAALDVPVTYMPKTPPKTVYVPVKVEAELHRIIHTVASHYGKDANVWLSEFLRPLLVEQHRLIAKDILKFSPGDDAPARRRP